MIEVKKGKVLLKTDRQREAVAEKERLFEEKMAEYMQLPPAHSDFEAMSDAIADYLADCHSVALGTMANEIDIVGINKADSRVLELLSGNMGFDLQGESTDITEFLRHITALRASGTMVELRFWVVRNVEHMRKWLIDRLGVAVKEYNTEVAELRKQLVNPNLTDEQRAKLKEQLNKLLLNNLVVKYTPLLQQLNSTEAKGVSIWKSITSGGTYFPNKLVLGVSFDSAVYENPTIQGFIREYAESKGLVVTDDMRNSDIMLWILKDRVDGALTVNLELSMLLPMSISSFVVNSRKGIVYSPRSGGSWGDYWLLSYDTQPYYIGDSYVGLDILIAHKTLLETYVGTAKGVLNGGMGFKEDTPLYIYRNEYNYVLDADCVSSFNKIDGVLVVGSDGNQDIQTLAPYESEHWNELPITDYPNRTRQKKVSNEREKIDGSPNDYYEYKYVEMVEYQELSESKRKVRYDMLASTIASAEAGAIVEKKTAGININGSILKSNKEFVKMVYGDINYMPMTTVSRKGGASKPIVNSWSYGDGKQLIDFPNLHKELPNWEYISGAVLGRTYTRAGDAEWDNGIAIDIADTGIVTPTGGMLYVGGTAYTVIDNADSTKMYSINFADGVAGYLKVGKNGIMNKSSTVMQNGFKRTFFTLMDIDGVYNTFSIGTSRDIQGYYLYNDGVLLEDVEPITTVITEIARELVGGVSNGV